MQVTGLSVMALLAASAAAAEVSRPQPLRGDVPRAARKVGLTMVGEARLPAPKGTAEVEMPNGGFERSRAGRPSGWSVSRTATVVEKPQDAPQGRSFLRIAAEGPHNVARSPLVAVEGNRPYLLSMWVRSVCEAAVAAWSDAQQHDRNVNCIGWTRRRLPNTGGRWRRVGVYVRAAPGSKHGRFDVHVSAGHGAAEAVRVELDDVRLRTATEAEFAAAYAGWRAAYPERNLSPRASDGKHLALSVAKLQGRGVGGKAFLIWAVGSSYTNMLGDGEHLRQHIRRRFPRAPEIVYKKRCGSAVPWQYVRGWVRQVVVPEQPDLVITYTLGRPEDLDALIVDLRRHTTADIIVPSIHWRIRDRGLWGKSEDAVDQKVQAVRDVCARHGVEFVENRREWAEYLRAHAMKVEVDAERGLLKDAVHQSEHGQLVICENVARHLAACAEPAYEACEREMTAPMSLAAAAGGGPRSPRRAGLVRRIVISGEWKPAGGSRRTARRKGAKAIVRFAGNRIDLIGVKTPDGGSARVLIDGRPADEAGVFFTNAILFSKVAPRTGPRKRGMMSDRAPHGVFLGRNVVPQTWTIRMTSDTGDYELTGSAAGHDGKGHYDRPFTSESGQIVIDPALWRHKSFNRAGDEFTFDVYRCATPRVSFRADGKQPQAFHLPLVQNLPAGKAGPRSDEHELTLVCEGDGAVTIDGFRVYRPPLR